MRGAEAVVRLSDMSAGLAMPEHADVVLRDGSTMRLRPPLRGDLEGLLAFFQGLSDESLYKRFHGHPSVEAPMVEPMLDPDWSERGALGSGYATLHGTRALQRSISDAAKRHLCPWPGPP